MLVFVYFFEFLAYHASVVPRYFFSVFDHNGLFASFSGDQDKVVGLGFRERQCDRCAAIKNGVKRDVWLFALLYRSLRHGIDDFHGIFVIGIFIGNDDDVCFFSGEFAENRTARFFSSPPPLTHTT